MINYHTYSMKKGTTIKIAISVRKTVFDGIKDLARIWKISRSELFTEAAEEFLERQKNLQTLTVYH